MEHWAKKFYEKFTQKHVQNTFGHFWERFWAFLEFWKFFDFLKTFRSLDPPWNTGQKKIFFEKSTPKTCSKHNWTLLGTILGIFGLLKFFRFFENISKTRPSMEHWAKKVYKKNTPKNVQNTFRQFGNNFGHFWNYENFSIFWKHFEDSTLHGTLGKKFFRKVPPKHVQNTIGQFWERFWAFLEFWKILDFWNHFEDSTLHGTLGKKNFRKSYPRNMFKTRLDILGTISGLFGMLKVFYFKKSISKNRLSAEQWAIKNFRKNYPQNMFKTQLHTFGNDFVHFWTFENFSIFWKHFEDSTLHGTLGKKCLRKNYPKTCSKHVWTIWERFWAFSECWKFFILKKAFRRIDSPRNNGQ